MVSRRLEVSTDAEEILHDTVNRREPLAWCCRGRRKHRSPTAFYARARGPEAKLSPSEPGLSEFPQKGLGDSSGTRTILVHGKVHPTHAVGVDRVRDLAQRGHDIRPLVNQPQPRQDQRIVGKNRAALIFEHDEIEGRDAPVGRERADNVRPCRIRTGPPGSWPGT